MDTTFPELPSHAMRLYRAAAESPAGLCRLSQCEMAKYKPTPQGRYINRNCEPPPRTVNQGLGCLA